MRRLAIVSTHPIQYYAPWFRQIAATPGVDLRVFYLWSFGVAETLDRGFGQRIVWDIPLLDGYASEFVPNVSRDPGTHHFFGITNPELPSRLARFAPDAVLMMGYNFASFAYVLARTMRRRHAVLLRGDSHRLAGRATRSIGWAREQARRAALAGVFAQFDGFLYVGAANRRYYEMHGVGASRLFFSPHSIESARFAPTEATTRAGRELRAKLGIPEKNRVVLFAGKFETKKRPTDLLAAFRAASPKNATLAFVGAGALEGELRAAAAASPEHDVVFAPFQNQSAMPAVYAAGDVIVLPSYGPSETWGLCVNEAMASGRGAIVSSHVGCAEDLVHPGENGAVFPAGDVAALTASLRDALASDDVLPRWGARSREVVRAYSFEAATRGLVEATEATLRRRRGGGPETTDASHAPRATGSSPG